MGNFNSKGIGYMYISYYTTKVYLKDVVKHNDLLIIHLKPMKKIYFNNCKTKYLNIFFNYKGNKININILGNNKINIHDNNKIYTKYSNYEDTEFCHENNHYYLVRKGYIKEIVCVLKNNFI